MNALAMLCNLSGVTVRAFRFAMRTRTGGGAGYRTLGMKPLALLALFAFAAPVAFVAAAPAAVQRARTKDVALAPDGVRGFGADLTQRGIDHLWSSRAEGDRAFLDSLTELSTEVRVAVLCARQHYSQCGYFKLLAGSAGDDLVLLHATYAAGLAHPATLLAAGDARAVAFAAMLVDTRFNVRRGLLEQAELSLRELDRARAVFWASVKGGYTTLIDAERENIAARADLAAAELRALRHDLHVLTPGAADVEKSAANLESGRRLIETAHIKDVLPREQTLVDLLDPRRELEQRMHSILFTARAEPDLRALQLWRKRVMAEGAALRAQALELLPDTAEGQNPSEAIAKLGKSERMREAAKLGSKGLLSDPLDPDLAWATGHAYYFQYVTRFDNYWGAASYMDRFLALSNLHFSDANPGVGAKLTERELEAFNVIRSYHGMP